MTERKFKIHPVIWQVLAIIAIIAIAIVLYSPFDRVLNAIQTQNYSKAIRISSIGAKVYPLPDWYSMRGYAKFQIGDYDGAIKDYDKAYNLETDDFKFINFDNKIYIKYYLKDYDGAVKDFDTEIANAKDDFIKDSFLWDKAQFLYNIGRYKEALGLYNNLLIKSDEDRIYLLKSRLFFERAQVYKKLGKEKQAKKDLDEARSENLDDSFENPIPVPALLLDNEQD